MRASRLLFPSRSVRSAPLWFPVSSEEIQEGGDETALAIVAASGAHTGLDLPYTGHELI